MIDPQPDNDFPQLAAWRAYRQQQQTQRVQWLVTVCYQTAKNRLQRSKWCVEAHNADTARRIALERYSKAYPHRSNQWVENVERVG